MKSSDGFDKQIKDMVEEEVQKRLAFEREAILDMFLQFGVLSHLTTHNVLRYLEREIISRGPCGKYKLDGNQPSIHGCHGARDGDCSWKFCPQLRDNEPHKTGRHCPLDVGDDDEC